MTTQMPLSPLRFCSCQLLFCLAPKESVFLRHGFIFILYFLSLEAYGILGPRLGIKPKASAVNAWSPNCWTAWEFLVSQDFKSFLFPVFLIALLTSLLNFDYYIYIHIHSYMPIIHNKCMQAHMWVSLLNFRIPDNRACLLIYFINVF